MNKVFYTKGIYSNGMVLQQNATNCIFGCGEAGKSVLLSFNNLTFQTVVGTDGNWKIEYAVGAAGGPYVLQLKSDNEEIVFNDVWVGEVWVNSGQSNAQLPMERMQNSYPQDFKNPQNDNIRMITVPITYNFSGEQDSVQNPQWKAANPENLREMSGTGYFFAKKLSQELKVPVGIINASQGGSPISAWMNKETLSNTKNMQRCLDEVAKWENPAAIEAKKADMQKNQSEWDTELWTCDEGNKNHWEKLEYSQIKDEWQDVEIPGDIDVLKSAGIVWLKKEVELTADQAELLNQKINGSESNLWLGTIVDADRAYVNGTQVGVTYYCYPPRRYKVPAGLLKAGKNTITLRIQKNSANGAIRFYKEKPYCLFTNNVDVACCVSRNVELQPENYIKCWDLDNLGDNLGHTAAAAAANAADSEKVFINLSGSWKMKIGAKVRDCPSGMFFEWVPTALYNSMLSPCFNYAVAGAIWYQGETDAYQPEAYKDLLTNMIYLWRKKFTYAVNGMPFVIMQLPNWSDGYPEDFTSAKIGWPKMRLSQKLVAEETEKCGLAVTVDAGEWNDLHPEKKQTGGTRAAMEALRVAYGKPVLPAPNAVAVEQNNDTFIVQFENCGTGLTVRGRSDNDIPGFYFVVETAENCSACGGASGKNELENFSENFIETTGTLISATEVKVKIPEAVNGQIKELRYLWSDSPNPIVLYGSQNLPAAPFSLKI